MTLPWTGERYLPEIKGQIGLEHLHRYVMARELASRKIVLDIACGEGYGSAMLAEVASSVIGVDFSGDAVAHAQLKYRKNNLVFTTGSCSSIPLKDASVDLVTSFETIEHHDEHEAMMAEIKRVLRPNGCLIISSPEKLEYSIVPGFSNKFHVKELFRAEFEALLASHFKNVLMYGQKIIYGSGIFLESEASRVTSYSEEHDRSQTKGIAHPIYLIAIASDAKIQKASSGIYEQTQFKSEVVVERDAQIASLNLAIVERDGHYAGLSQLMTERESQLAVLNQTIVERDAQVADLNHAVADRESQIAVLNQTMVERESKVASLTQAVTEWEGRIAALSQSIVERDGQVASLNQAVAEREDQIAALNQSIVERDRHFAGLSQTATERESQIVGLSQSIVDRDGQVASLSQTLVERENQITILNQLIVERDDRVAELVQAVAEFESQIAGLTQAIAESEDHISRFTLQLDAEQKARHQSEQDGARRENALLAKSGEAFDSLEKLVREHSQLDHERASQMQGLRDQAEQDKAGLTHSHSEHEHALSQNHAEKERILLLQFDAERKTSRNLEQGLRQLERMLQDEITGLRIELEVQKHANQLSAQQYNSEISATKIERNLALQARNTAGARVFAEQQENNLLRQELTELHRYLGQIQSSFSWRLLTPLRKLGALGAPPTGLTNNSVSLGHDPQLSRRIADPFRKDQFHIADESRFAGQTLQSERNAETLAAEASAIDMVTTMETNAFPPMEAPDCETLMQYEDRQFIDAAYVTLLKRLPDADGMAFYLGSLHDGASKLQILREIFFSQECRDAGLELPGLRETFSHAESLL